MHVYNIHTYKYIFIYITFALCCLAYDEQWWHGLNSCPAHAMAMKTSKHINNLRYVQRMQQGEQKNTDAIKPTANAWYKMNVMRSQRSTSSTSGVLFDVLVSEFLLMDTCMAECCARSLVRLFLAFVSFFSFEWISFLFRVCCFVVVAFISCDSLWKLWPVFMGILAHSDALCDSERSLFMPWLRYDDCHLVGLTWPIPITILAM